MNKSSELPRGLCPQPTHTTDCHAASKHERCLKRCKRAVSAVRPGRERASSKTTNPSLSNSASRIVNFIACTSPLLKAKGVQNCGRCKVPPSMRGEFNYTGYTSSWRIDTY